MIGAARRLHRLEGSAEPRQAVLRWLDEAHAHGSLDASVRSLLDGHGGWPYIAVPEQARAHAREAVRGRAATEVLAAERRAIGDALFLLELVLAIETHTRERTTTLGLCVVSLRWERRARSAEGCDEAGWSAWRAHVAELLATVRREDAARQLLETQYLDGRPVLFPDTAAAWTRLLGLVDDLADDDPAIVDAAIAVVAESDGRGVARELRLLARARALVALGDHDRAVMDVEQELRRGSA